MKKVTIIGGGISGLSAAYGLSNNGEKVELFEKEDDFGGLARTEKIKGGLYDRGPHGYHSDNKNVVVFLKKILKNNLLQYGKYVEIKYHDKYYRYPLKPLNILWNMPLSLSVKCATALLWSKVKYIIRKPKSRNAEEWLTAHFGKPLYEAFFKDYTEKVWGVKIKELSSIFPQHRIPIIRFSDIILRGLLNLKKTFGKQNKYAPMITTIYYPKKGGAQSFVNRLSQEAKKKGAKLHKNSEITKINIKKNRVESIVVKKGKNSKTVKVDELITTAPVTELLQLIRPKIKVTKKDMKRVKYRSLVVVCINVNKNQVFKPQHYYYYDKTFNRLTEMKNWSQYLYPKGKTGLMAEITCDYNDNIWNMNEKSLCENIIKEIEYEKLIKRKDVSGYGIIRIKYAYPIYLKGFQRSLKKIGKELRKIENINMIGRQAKFKYMNMDNCIEQGFTLANKLSDRNKNHFKGK